MCLNKYKNYLLNDINLTTLFIFEFEKFPLVIKTSAQRFTFFKSKENWKK